MKQMTSVQPRSDIGPLKFGSNARATPAECTHTLVTGHWLQFGQFTLVYISVASVASDASVASLVKLVKLGT